MKTGRNAALRRGTAVLLLAGAASVMAANRTAAEVYSIALPDITSKRFSARPETVPAGGTVEIRHAVWNLGAGELTPRHGAGKDGPALTIGFLLVRNLKDRRGLAAGSWSLDALKRHEVAWHTAVWTVPETTIPGSYFLCADVDPQNTLKESNEHNNRACLPLTVEPAPGIAVRDAPGQGPPEPDPAAPGEGESEPENDGSGDRPEHVPPEEPAPVQPGGEEDEPEDGEAGDTGAEGEPGISGLPIPAERKPEAP